MIINNHHHYFVISLNIMMMLSHLLKYVQATFNTLLHPGIGVIQDQIGSVSGQKIISIVITVL